MGLFGGSGIFGKMFDLNGDGKVDCFEQGMEFMFLNELTRNENDDLDDDSEDDDLDDDNDEDW